MEEEEKTIFDRENNVSSAESDIETKKSPPDPGAFPEAGSNDDNLPSICPACGRRLLSKASALCNWCGAKIENEIYQEKAAQERTAADRELREKLLEEARETANFGVVGRLKRLKKEAAKEKQP
jgi:predicted amidophosphoribosyltransferase